MTTAKNLEHNLESLESLPVELQRIFTLMRDLDGRAHTVMKEIETGCKNLRMVKSGNSKRRKELSKEIQRLFCKAKDYAAEKVRLTNETSEIVDKLIPESDPDSATNALPPSSQKGRREKKSKKPSALEVEEKSNKGGSAKSTRKKPTSRKIMAAEKAAGGSSGELLRIRKYCICHGPESGVMILCDGECNEEWYHKECVGVGRTPKGKWYCSRCKEEKEKREN